MLNTKDAYKILGLKEDAKKEDVVKRYNLLLKKYHVSKKSGLTQDITEETMEEINNAFNHIMGYETKKPANEKTKRKIGDYFYYYKPYIVIGTILSIILIYAVVQYVTRVVPDLEVAFVGDYTNVNVGVLKKNISNDLPEVKEVSINTNIISEENPDTNKQLKAMAVLFNGNLDVYIVNKAYFDTYAQQGAFMSLDDLIDELKIDSKKNEQYIVKIGERQDEHLYGLDVGESEFFKKANIKGEEKIAVIGAKSKNRLNAIKFLKLLLE